MKCARCSRKEAPSRATAYFFAADLERDAGWPESVAGCEYVLHVASPFPSSIPKHEDELIVQAREGALRVLRAARDAGVKRVVLTSSVCRHRLWPPAAERSFRRDELDGSEYGDDVLPMGYGRLSRTRRVGFHRFRRPGAEMIVVNPVGVFRPVLGPDYSTSILMVQRLMDGAMPGCPQLYFGVVDVRDVADLHIRAMTDPAAKGERFLAVAGDFLSMQAIAKVLKRADGRGR